MNRQVIIPGTEIIDIHSAHADADYQLWVATPIPGAMPMPPGPRKVLYVLDANLFFGTAVEMTRLMSQLYGELPPLLVVGIAYETSSPAIQAQLRARDFTPTADSGFGAPPAAPGAPEPVLPEEKRVGRAAQFLQFLNHEVQPLISRKYDVAEDGSMLFGSSLGGLFVLYTLLRTPGAFDAYAAVSPALWWDKSMLLDELAVFDRPGEFIGKTLFLAVGGEEERKEIPMLAQFRMISNLRDFAARLQEPGPGSPDVSLFIAEGETHTSVVPVALTRALRHFHTPKRPPR